MCSRNGGLQRGVLESVFTGIAIKRNVGENLVWTVSNETLLQTLGLWIIIIILLFSIFLILNFRSLAEQTSNMYYIYMYI